MVKGLRVIDDTNLIGNFFLGATALTTPPKPMVSAQIIDGDLVITPHRLSTTPDGTCGGLSTLHEKVCSNE
jgi:hypothetical protein